jgi:outer membrane protein OmpA-like peptidoglycan-associated protein
MYASVDGIAPSNKQALNHLSIYRREINMAHNNLKTKSGAHKWVYLPLVFSSAAILATQISAAPFSQQYQEPRQVGTANYEYVGGRTQVGGYISDDGDVTVDINHAFHETENSSSSIGLWGDVDLKGDGDTLEAGGVQLNHNWVSRDRAGNASHVNKVFAAYDRNEDDHDKATVGYGQEYENLFWEGHASKGLSDKKLTSIVGPNGKKVYSKAYDYGVGGSVGTFLKGSNTRVRAGLDHEWGDEEGIGEDTPTNTTLSAGIEKFFQGTPHSVSLDVAASRKDGGTEIAGADDTDVTASLGYHYDFGGASIYQPDQRYRRVRVEVPSKGRSARFVRKPIYKRVPTYKNVSTYAKKTVKKPYKQLVKSTMELEGQTFFKLNSAKLIPSAQARLKQIASEIRRNGYRGAIRITGNTCGLGNAAYDQRLSEQRARAVRNFLISQGFKADHLIARGLGKGHPKYPNTPSQGFKNRRVDIEYVTERKAYKTAYRTEQQTVRTGTRRVVTGFKNVPAGYKNVMVDAGYAGAPRVIWRTEAIKTSPPWIRRALHNNIKHDRNVNTYLTTAGNPAPVVPVNSAPIAVDDVRSTACNTPVTIDVLGNDSDANTTDVLSVLSFTQPAHGSVVRGENGTLIYTPDGTACGQADTFSYVVSDGQGGTATANVTVNVDGTTAENTAPDAVDDYETTEMGEAVTINVLSNDSDPENDPLTITSFTQASNGTVTRGSNGQLIYTPEDGFTGTDTFTYTISDGNGGSDTATVHITIPDNGGAENNDPKAQDDRRSTECRTPITIDVLANDFDADGDNLTITDVSNFNDGVAEIVNNKIVFTPNDDACGKTGKFTYTISDGNGGTDTAKVKIEIGEGSPANEAPIAVNDSATAACSAITINVLDNDSDPDGDALKILSLGDTALGMAVISGNNIIYTPDKSCGPGTDKFSYTISDGNGHTASANVDVTVKSVPGCNTDCTIAESDDVTTRVDETVMIDVLANDAGRGLKIRKVDDPKHGTASIRGNSIKYTPAPGFTGTDSFWYQVVDPTGYKDAALIVVYVEEACDAGSKCN